MTKPYAIISDTHLHNWSAFANPLANGVNSRLDIILNEIERCAKTLADIGGDTIIHAGDLFHVRGSVAPSVMNPTKERLWLINQMYDTQFKILGGNHDFEGKHSTRLGNAVAALECDYIHAVDKSFVDSSNKVVMIPWHESISALREQIVKHLTAERQFDLIIHAPIDDVISGIPNHGLTASELGNYGFRRVFAGHYHHHKDFGNGVYSIGALVQHTWSDVRSKAGFLIVSDTVKWHCSHAPGFVDLVSTKDTGELELLAQGNYVRMKMTSSKMADIEEIREWLKKAGAIGSLIQIVKEPIRRRPASSTASSSIEEAIGGYIDSHYVDNREEITKRALMLFGETT